MTAALRVGLVGVGNRAYLGQQVPRACPGAAIVAAADPDPRGRERAREMFPGAARYSATAELLAAEQLDAAIVTSPDDTHQAIAIEFLRAGVAVFVDKPLATSLEEADAILTVAQETGTPLYVGHNLRHWEAVKVMRGIIERGEIGEVQAIWVRHFIGNGGDYFFKDWHADRSRTGSLLVQKASHDIDIIHFLAGAYTSRVVGMGDLMVYGDVADRAERVGQIASDWFSHANWPPRALTGLNPVIDVEDMSMMMMRLENGVLASYQQSHFTPDYWRNYTVIGTEGRLENFGDTTGGTVRVWNRRVEWQAAGHAEYPIRGEGGGHEAADLATLTEFFASVVDGAPTVGDPFAARQAVAVGALAAASLRHGSVPHDIPPFALREGPSQNAAGDS